MSVNQFFGENAKGKFDWQLQSAKAYFKGHPKKSHNQGKISTLLLKIIKLLCMWRQLLKKKKEEGAGENVAINVNWKLGNIEYW